MMRWQYINSAYCLPAAQFITHTVGRVLGDMALQPTPIDTRGFQSLLSLVDNTTHDSFDLYYGLFMYNEARPFLPAQTLLQGFLILHYALMQLARTHDPPFSCASLLCRHCSPEGLAVPYWPVPGNMETVMRDPGWLHLRPAASQEPGGG